MARKPLKEWPAYPKHPRGYPEEDKLDVLVGRLFRLWGKLDLLIAREIEGLQRIAQARHVRFPRSLYPDTPRGWSPTTLWLKFPEMPRYSEERLIMCKSMGADLSWDPDEFRKKFKTLKDTITNIKAMRDNIAHGDSRIDFFHKPYFEVEVYKLNKKWRDTTMERALKGLQKREYARSKGYTAKKPPPHTAKVTYSVAQLEKANERLHFMWWEFRDLLCSIPIEAPPHLRKFPGEEGA
jgi:hypothetical protein